MTILHPPETAPKDGTQILGSFGYPWIQVAAWCSYSESWAVATMGASPGEDDETLSEVWFETEYEKASELQGWMPLPELPQRLEDTPEYKERFKGAREFEERCAKAYETQPEWIDGVTFECDGLTWTATLAHMGKTQEKMWGWFPDPAEPDRCRCWIGVKAI